MNYPPPSNFPKKSMFHRLIDYVQNGRKNEPAIVSATPSPLAGGGGTSPEPLTHCVSIHEYHPRPKRPKRPKRPPPPRHRSVSVTSLSLSPSSALRDHRWSRPCVNRCGFSGNDDMIEAHERICSYYRSQDYSNQSMSLETICGSSHHINDHTYQEGITSSDASRCQCAICYHMFGYTPSIKVKCLNCDTALCNKCYMRALGHTEFPKPNGSEPWLRADLD
jgi:hypothetical protein